MSPAATLAGFAVVLAALFGGGAAVGRVLDADAPGGQAEAPMAAEAPAMQDMTESHTEKKAGDHGAMRMPVRGLAVAENGLRLVVADAELRRDRTERLRFRIVDERGRAVRDFDLEHTKRMHLIVARRDLGTFQHLHPTMRADGTWSTPLRLSDAGSYRVFADFSHDDEATTLASDLRVDGPADLAPLPSRSRSRRATAASTSASTAGPRAPAARASCASRCSRTADPSTSSRISAPTATSSRSARGISPSCTFTRSGTITVTTRRRTTTRSASRRRSRRPAPTACSSRSSATIVSTRSRSRRT